MNPRELLANYDAADQACADAKSGPAFRTAEEQRRQATLAIVNAFRELNGLGVQRLRVQGIFEAARWLTPLRAERMVPNYAPDALFERAMKALRHHPLWIEFWPQVHRAGWMHQGARLGSGRHLPTFDVRINPHARYPTLCAIQAVLLEENPEFTPEELHVLKGAWTAAMANTAETT
ncbi:hypothetical protein [Deinococcus sp. PEB2-67]